MSEPEKVEVTEWEDYEDDGDFTITLFMTLPEVSDG